MTILPVSTSTASEKLRTILLVIATAVASSAGDNEEIVGAVPATVELLVTLVLAKSTTSFPSESCIALASLLPEGSV